MYRGRENGAKEALVRVTYAPGIAGPLDVTWSFADGGRPPAGARFDFRNLLDITRGQWRRLRDSGRGAHFFDLSLPWNSLVTLASDPVFPPTHSTHHHPMKNSPPSHEKLTTIP